MSAAIAHRKVGIDEFSNESLKDKKICSLSNKVTPKLKESLNRKASSPAIVEIMTRRGKKYSKQVEKAYGNPENPMSMAAIVAKLKDCVSYAERPVSEEHTLRLIDIVSELENVEDVRQIVSLLE